MPLLREMVDQGLVTRRHPALLRPGELQRADDCEYLPDTPALSKVPGRALFSNGDTSAVAIKGIIYLPFSNPAYDTLLAFLGTGYTYQRWSNARASSGITGAGGVLDGLLDASHAACEVVSMNYRHFLLNGADRPRYCALYSGVVAGYQTTQPVFSIAYMDPVNTIGGAVVTATGGTGITWPGDPFGNGVYWFLVTEVSNPDTEDEVESAFTGTPVSCTVVDYKTTYIVVTRQTAPGGGASTTPINTGSNGQTATHWRIYMVGPWPNTVGPPPLSLYRAVGGAIPLGQGTASLGVSVAEDRRSPSTSADVATFTAFDGTRGSGTDNLTKTVAAGNALDGAYQTGSTTESGNPAGVELHTYNHTAVVPTGITVRVTFRWRFSGKPFDSSEFAGFQVKLLNKTLATASAARFVREATANLWTTVKVGGQGDLWGLTINAGDNLGVQILLNHSGDVTQYVDLDTVEVSRHTVNVNVDLAGKALDVVALVPRVGNPIEFPANLPGPVSSTGCVFQGSVVVNDVAQSDAIAYTPPGLPHGFPGPYRLRFGSEGGAIVALRTLGNGILVLRQRQVGRVGYLPQQGDDQFDGGQPYDVLSQSIGCVGVTAVAFCDWPEVGRVLAFVSGGGLYLTDGSVLRHISGDLDWANSVELSLLNIAQLVNDPVKHQLRLYCTPKNGTANTQAFYFHYHPSHLKAGGGPSITGPVTVNARSAASITPQLASKGPVGTYPYMVQAEEPVILTGHSTNGKLYREDYGTTDGSGGTINPLIRTRQIAVGRPLAEARVGPVTVHVTSTPSPETSTTAGFLVTLARQNVDEARTALPDSANHRSLDSLLGGRARIDFDEGCETVDITVQKNGSTQTAALTLNMIEADVDGGGE